MTRRERFRVLMDTGPLYALLDDQDSEHGTAVAILEELEGANAEITCAYPAALETHRLMVSRKRITIDHAHALITDALEIFTPTMPTREDADEALESLRRYSDQKITLADATIAATARRERLLVFTFDERQRHFQFMGATLYTGQGR